MSVYIQTILLVGCCAQIFISSFWTFSLFKKNIFTNKSIELHLNAMALVLCSTVVLNVCIFERISLAKKKQKMNMCVCVRKRYRENPIEKCGYFQRYKVRFYMVSYWNIHKIWFDNGKNRPFME